MGELLIIFFTPKNLLYVLISAIPIIGWILLFQKINHEKKWYVFITFMAGMISVIPIKIYEKYWNEALFYLEHINLLKYFQELLIFPEISQLLLYIGTHALLAFLFYIFIAGLMFFFEILTGDNTVKIFQKKIVRAVESPFLFISIGVLAGVIAFLFSIFQRGDIAIGEKIAFLVVGGMLEEYIKHLVLRFSDDEKIESVDDALSFSILVALGFAFVENIMYFERFMSSEFGNSFKNIAIFFLLRSTISVAAHISFSGIFGYYYGISRFANEICREEIFKVKYKGITFLNQIFHGKKEVLFHEEKLFEGMMLAMITHIIYNTLLQYNKMFGVIIFLLALFIFMLSLFHRKHFHEKRGQLTQNNVFSNAIAPSKTKT